MSSIYLKIRKTSASHRWCTVPKCGITTNLRSISKTRRLKSMKMDKVFIPNGSRACSIHFAQENWRINTKLENKFSSAQLEEMVQMLCDSTISSSPVGPHNSDTMEYFIGLKPNQFEQVFASVSGSLLGRYKELSTSRNALYIYLMKLKTNHTNQQIAVHFSMSQRSISSRIKDVREIVHKEFALKHLYQRSRAELLENTTELSRMLYNKSNDVAICIWDATYEFTIKSSNYYFQKESYSVQKKRNLLKVMLCVMPNGLIAGTFGPYSARKNDATILNELLDTNQSIFQNFRPGDVMVLDRGFRDSVAKVKSHGFEVKIPECKSNSKNQLSTKQANDSRLVTKTRFAIEVRNSHIKNKWKYLSAVKNVESIPYLMKDFEVCTSLVNAFCRNIISDKHDFELIGKRMLELRNIPNNISRFASKIPRNAFQMMQNLTLFPKITLNDLKYMSLGTYQIAQARSYCQNHLRANENQFVLFYCADEESKKLCTKIGASTSKPALVYVKLRSRFQSSKHHNTYVLFNLDATGKDVLVAYCCSCKNGLRTIGCCSHTMTVVWYLYYIDHNNLKLPSSNLNNILVLDESEEDGEAISAESDSDS